MHLLPFIYLLKSSTNYSKLPNIILILFSPPCPLSIYFLFIQEFLLLYSFFISSLFICSEYIQVLHLLLTLVIASTFTLIFISLAFFIGPEGLSLRIGFSWSLNMFAFRSSCISFPFHVSFASPWISWSLSPTYIKSPSR